MMAPPGKAAAGRDVPVHDDINAKQHDHRHEELGGELENLVVLGLVEAIVILGFQPRLGGFAVLVVVEL